MKEEIAKTKWCPHVRRDSLTIEAHQSVTDKTKGGRAACIGSDCVHGCDRDGSWLGHCGLTK